MQTVVIAPSDFVDLGFYATVIIEKISKEKEYGN